MAQADRS